MFQVAQEILRNPEDKTQVSLIFANQTEEDIILRKELDDMAAKHDNFQVTLAVDQSKTPVAYTKKSALTVECQGLPC